MFINNNNHTYYSLLLRDIIIYLKNISYLVEVALFLTLGLIFIYFQFQSKVVATEAI